jgi:hypothetical protein
MSLVADDDLARAREAAVAMLGAPAEVVPVRTAGRNSRIFHVRAREEYALKLYPDDPRDRLGTEIAALALMEGMAVPRVKAVDRRRGCVLLSWIDGVPVDDVTDADIEAGLAFLACVHALRNADGAAQAPAAAQACLSGAEIERQIETRLARLRRTGEAPLIGFIESDFVPAFGRSRAEARAALGSRLDFAADIPHQWQSLVPSDFGYHNCLRRPDGSLVFVDFEYFGWDDPVKLTADILLHPGRPLAAAQRRRFRAAAERLYGDPLFAPRLSAYLPLFGLRWVLILLNEFVPEVWARRARAADSWNDVKARQLRVAREFLMSLPARVAV